LTKFLSVPENGETPTSPVRTAAEGSVPTAMTTKLENTGLTYLLRACSDDTACEATGRQVVHETLEGSTSVHEGCTFHELSCDCDLPGKSADDVFQSCLALGFDQRHLELFGIHDCSHEWTDGDIESFDCVPCFDISDGLHEVLEVLS
jgi:hypothetical protein